MGSYVPVREMGVNDIRNKSYVNCENEMKRRNDRRKCYAIKSPRLQTTY